MKKSIILDNGKMALRKDKDHFIFQKKYFILAHSKTENQMEKDPSISSKKNKNIKVNSKMESQMV